MLNIRVGPTVAKPRTVRRSVERKHGQRDLKVGQQEAQNDAWKAGHKDTRKTGQRDTRKTGQKDERDGRGGQARDRSHVKGEKEKISALFQRSTLANAKHIPQTTVETHAQEAQDPFARDDFYKLKLHPALVSHLQKLDFVKPTRIQQLTIPPLLSDQQVTLVQAHTGSGKTMAYLLPILHRLMSITDPLASRSSGVLAVIVAPTRELALQISTVAEKLVMMKAEQRKEHGYLHHWITTGLFVGNTAESRKAEKTRLRKGINLVICTPGRLLDHLQKTESFLQSLDVKWLVVDEADRVMELGMEETIRQCLDILDQTALARESDDLRVGPVKLRVLKRGSGWEALPEKRQTILCSATVSSMTKDVSILAARLVQGVEPLKIYDQPTAVAKDGTAEELREDELSLPAQLRQRFVPSPTKLRLVTLISLLRKSVGPESKVIVFCNTREEVEFLWTLLGTCPNEPEKDEIALESRLIPGTIIYKLHGAMPQSQRTASFLALGKPSKLVPILITTDLSSRGLDLIVSTVVHYTPPATVADYVHRCGRSARLGRGGESIWITDPEKTKESVEWIRAGTLHEATKDVGLQLLEGVNAQSHWTTESAEQALLPLFSHFGSKKANTLAAMDVQLQIERWVLKESVGSMARNAYLAHIKSFGAYPKNVKALFSIRHLHLGHVAKSFGLRETPNEVSKSKSVQADVKKQKEEEVQAERKLKKRKVQDEWDLAIGADDEVAKKRGVKKFLNQGPKAGKRQKRSK